MHFVHLMNPHRQNILRIILSLVCAPFHLVKSALNEFLFMKTHQVSNRLSKCANVRYCKNQVFLWFTINSQSKLEEFSTQFLRHLPRKTRYEIFRKVSWWNLWIRDTRNFHNSFFVKNYYLNLNSFSNTAECSP